MAQAGVPPTAVISLTVLLVRVWLRSVVPPVLVRYAGQLPVGSSVQSISRTGVPVNPVLVELSVPRCICVSRFSGS